jgi:hypothetical protein
VLVLDIHAVSCPASRGPVSVELACGFLDSSVCEIIFEALEDLVVSQRLNESGCMRSQ